MNVLMEKVIIVYINPGAYIEKEIDGEIGNIIIQYLNDDLLPDVHSIESLVENLSHIQCFCISDGEQNVNA